MKDYALAFPSRLNHAIISSKQDVRLCFISSVANRWYSISDLALICCHGEAYLASTSRTILASLVSYDHIDGIIYNETNRNLFDKYIKYPEYILRRA